MSRSGRGTRGREGRDDGPEPGSQPVPGSQPPVEPPTESFRSGRGALIGVILAVVLAVVAIFALVNLEFKMRGSDDIGRQSQTWVKFPGAGWKVVGAHVSLMNRQPVW